MGAKETQGRFTASVCQRVRTADDGAQCEQQTGDRRRGDVVAAQRRYHAWTGSCICGQPFGRVCHGAGAAAVYQMGDVGGRWDVVRSRFAPWVGSVAVMELSIVHRQLTQALVLLPGLRSTAAARNSFEGSVPVRPVRLGAVARTRTTTQSTVTGGCHVEKHGAVGAQKKAVLGHVGGTTAACAGAYVCTMYLKCLLRRPCRYVLLPLCTRTTAEACRIPRVARALGARKHRAASSGPDSTRRV